ncbi:hypothetical protein CJ739_2512 [Mariniflexile rhizosphaerae]|nr:hypothetical protein CJ739_2512 [Mariniflexile sp. TRM1-10]
MVLLFVVVVKDICFESFYNIYLYIAWDRNFRWFEERVMEGETDESQICG